MKLCLISLRFLAAGSGSRTRTKLALQRILSSQEPLPVQARINTKQRKRAYSLVNSRPNKTASALKTAIVSYVGATSMLPRLAYFELHQRFWSALRELGSDVQSRLISQVKRQRGVAIYASTSVIVRSG